MASSPPPQKKDTKLRSRAEKVERYIPLCKVTINHLGVARLLQIIAHDNDNHILGSVKIQKFKNSHE